MAVPPATIAIIGAIGALGAVGTFVSYDIAEKIGKQLTPQDFFPMPPPYPPLPRFLYTKPEIVSQIRNEMDSNL